MSTHLVCALLITAISSGAFAQTSLEQQAEKEQGLILYNQNKAVSAAPFLTVAAQAGDHEAQYFLGECLRKKNHYMNLEARKWYETSAAQGDLYAMIQLGRSENLCELSQDCPTRKKTPIEWLNEAQRLAKPKAESRKPSKATLKPCS